METFILPPVTAFTATPAPCLSWTGSRFDVESLKKHMFPRRLRELSNVRGWGGHRRDARDSLVRLLDRCADRSVGNRRACVLELTASPFFREQRANDIHFFFALLMVVRLGCRQVALESFNTTHTIHSLILGEQPPAEHASPKHVAASTVLHGHQKTVLDTHAMHQVGGMVAGCLYTIVHRWDFSISRTVHQRARYLVDWDAHLLFAAQMDAENARALVLLSAWFVPCARAEPGLL